MARRRSAVLVAAAAALAAVPAAAAMPVPDHEPTGLVKILGFAYRAHTGAERLAFLVLPRWYGPRGAARIAAFALVLYGAFALARRTEPALAAAPARAAAQPAK